MIGMGAAWKKREVAEHLIHAAADLVENWHVEDIDKIEVREYISGWLARLPGHAWDDRLGLRPEHRKAR